MGKIHYILHYDDLTTNKKRQISILKKENDTFVKHPLKNQNEYSLFSTMTAFLPKKKYALSELPEIVYLEKSTIEKIKNNSQTKVAAGGSPPPPPPSSNNNKIKINTSNEPESRAVAGSIPPPPPPSSSSPECITITIYFEVKHMFEDENIEYIYNSVGESMPVVCYWDKEGRRRITKKEMNELLQKTVEGKIMIIYDNVSRKQAKENITVYIDKKRQYYIDYHIAALLQKIIPTPTNYNGYHLLTNEQFKKLDQFFIIIIQELELNEHKPQNKHQ
jgi:hypothetical protein